MYPLSKRPKNVLDTDSSSDGSLYQNSTILWDSIANDTSFLKLNDIKQEIDNEVDALLDKSVPWEYKLEECYALATELYRWLKKIRQRFASQKVPRVSVYSAHPEMRELQQHDSKRRVLFSLVVKLLPEVSGIETFQLKEHAIQTSSSMTMTPVVVRSTAAATLNATNAPTTAPTGTLLISPAASANHKNDMTTQSIKQPAQRSKDTMTAKLMTLLDRLLEDWDETLQRIQPIDPLEDKDKLFEDIRLDLDEVSTWVNLLQSNLPSTSTWMTTIDRLTDVQRHSALNYYQTNLKQVESHVRTLSAVNELLLRVWASSGIDLHHKIKLNELTQTLSHLEALCHVTWLRLLELTTCLEHNFRVGSRPYAGSQHSQCRKYKSATSNYARLPRSESYSGSAQKEGSQKIRTRFQSCNIVDNPMEQLPFMRKLDERRPVRSTGNHTIKIRASAQTAMLSPVAQKGALESGFESELSPQPHCCDFVRTAIHNHAPAGWLNADGDTLRDNRGRICSASNLCFITESTLSIEGQTPVDGQTQPESDDRFEVLTAPVDDLTSQLTSADSNPVMEGDQCGKTEHPDQNTEHNYSPTEQEEPITTDPLKDVISTTDPLLLSSRTERSSKKRKFRVHRATRGKRLVGPTTAKYNCRSTPVLSTVPPIYRIMMRKPTRRLLLARSGDTKGARTTTDWSRPDRSQVTTERIPVPPDVQLVWHTRWLSSRVNKTTEAELDDLSTQDVSLRTTTPSSGAADPKKTEAVAKPASFVLVRHKSRRQPAPLVRKIRRNPSHRRSHPLISRHKSRLSGRAHSFCIPYSSGLDRPSATTRGSHSDSSSIEGEGSDPEYRLWQTRIKSYLDAAAQADALVRSKYGPAALRQYLFSSNKKEQTESGPGVTSSTDDSSPLVRRKPQTALPEGMDRGLDYQEPLLNFWDDYQHLWRRRPYSAPLYSNSSDTDGCEPVSTYAEEFPWDDMAASCLSDASQEEDLFLRNIRSSKPESSSYAQVNSTANTSGNAANNTGQSPVLEDAAALPVCRQDTMELSTSTSVLFNQKSSSLEASFEVCSHSAGTGELIVLGTHESSGNQFNGSELLCGLRTHPDGGSQHCLNRDSTNEVVQATVLHALDSPTHQTALSVPTMESNFLTHCPIPAAEQELTTDTESKLSCFMPYLMDRRKCQTLPRASVKRRHRLQSAYATSVGDHANGSRLSTTASLNELYGWNGRGSRLSILHFSKQRLLELRNLLHRLMEINPVHDKEIAPSIAEKITVEHWHRSLSHVIHLAEANLQLLTDHTFGSAMCSPKCICKHTTGGIQSQSAQPCVWSNCPELNSLQYQWMRFTDQARYWLLQSYSQEATQQQLAALKVRIYELNESLQRILASDQTTFGVRYGVLETQPARNAASSFPTDHSLRLVDDELMRQIRHCVQEVEGLGDQVHRLRQEFECHVIQKRARSHDPELLPTATFVEWRDDNLVKELDQLSHEVSVNKQRLTSWLTMRSIDTEEQLSSDEQEWEHVDYPTECTEEKQNPLVETISQSLIPSSVSALDRQDSEPASEIIVQPRHATMTGTEHKRHCYVVLLVSSLIALVYFVYYIVSQLAHCGHRPCKWRGALLTLEHIFGLSENGPGCPLQRERLSSVVDYTPGSLPF